MPFSPHTNAWAEAEAIVRQDVTILYTLEFQHPGFQTPQGAAMPVRIVAGLPDDKILRIEAGALFNPGALVTFTAIPFSAGLPEFGEKQVPQVTITVDNVARELLPHFEKALEFRANLDCLYREYISDDPNTVAYGPVAFIIKRARVVGATVQGVAQLENLSNWRFPRRVYNLTEFPQLHAS